MESKKCCVPGCAVKDAALSFPNPKTSLGKFTAWVAFAGVNISAHSHDITKLYEEFKEKRMCNLHFTPVLCKAKDGRNLIMYTVPTLHGPKLVKNSSKSTPNILRKTVTTPSNVPTKASAHIISRVTHNGGPQELKTNASTAFPKLTEVFVVRSLPNKNDRLRIRNDTYFSVPNELNTNMSTTNPETWRKTVLILNKVPTKTSARTNSCLSYTEVPPGLLKNVKTCTASPTTSRENITTANNEPTRTSPRTKKSALSPVLIDESSTPNPNNVSVKFASMVPRVVPMEMDSEARPYLPQHMTSSDFRTRRKTQSKPLSNSQGSKKRKITTDSSDDEYSNSDVEDSESSTSSINEESNSDKEDNGNYSEVEYLDSDTEQSDAEGKKLPEIEYLDMNKFALEDNNNQENVALNRRPDTTNGTKIVKTRIYEQSEIQIPKRRNVVVENVAENIEVKTTTLEPEQTGVKTYSRPRFVNTLPELHGSNCAKLLPPNSPKLALQTTPTLPILRNPQKKPNVVTNTENTEYGRVISIEGDSNVLYNMLLQDDSLGLVKDNPTLLEDLKNLANQSFSTDQKDSNVVTVAGNNNFEGVLTMEEPTMKWPSRRAGHVKQVITIDKDTGNIILKILENDTKIENFDTEIDSEPIQEYDLSEYQPTEQVNLISKSQPMGQSQPRGQRQLIEQSLPTGQVNQLSASQPQFNRPIEYQESTTSSSTQKSTSITIQQLDNTRLQEFTKKHNLKMVDTKTPLYKQLTAAMSNLRNESVTNTTNPQEQQQSDASTSLNSTDTNETKPTKLYLLDEKGSVLVEEDLVMKMQAENPQKQQQSDASTSIGSTDTIATKPLTSYSAVELRKELKALRIELSRCKTRLKCFKEKLKDSRDIMKNKSFAAAASKMQRIPRMLTTILMRESLKNKKGHRFTEDEKELCHLLHKQCSVAYNYLRKMGFIAPNPKGLNSRDLQVDLDSALKRDDALQKLKAKVDKMEAEDRLCVLIFDEKLIHPANRNKRVVTAIGNTGEEVEVAFEADHALIFMVKGIVKHYQELVSYSFSLGPTEGSDLASQIKSVMTDLQAIGYRVLATICDQAESNRTAIDILVNEARCDSLLYGHQYNERTFRVNNEEIIALYDPPHLLKGIRNHLISKTLTFEMDGQNKTAEWKHIEMLLHENPEYNSQKLIPKLTIRHVYPTKLGISKTKYASQIFSQTIAMYLGYLGEKGILPPESCHTADLLLFFDSLFDSVNNSVANTQKNKPLLLPVKSRSTHHIKWTESIQILKTMAYKNNDSVIEVPDIDCWVWTLEGFLLLMQTLFVKYNVESVWMRNLNQDVLESLFKTEINPSPVIRKKPKSREAKGLVITQRVIKAINRINNPRKSDSESVSKEE